VASPPINDLLERFEGELRRLDLPGEARGILIGASAGSDSTALCRLFALARDRRSGTAWPPIWLGHVHHGLRGAEADGDADFVRGLAGELGFLHLEERVEPARGGRGVVSESAARSARYEAFSRWTARHPIDAVALAHTADDQAETVLLRLIRRAGLRGLGGMPRERPLKGRQPDRFPRLVRPLLEARRGELRSFLEELGQPWREDSTNRSPAYLRNRVRHHLLPFLRSEFAPAADDALIEVARIAGEAARDLAEIARRAIERAGVRRGAGVVQVDAESLRSIPPSARPFALEILAGEFPGEPRGPTSLRQLAEVRRWFEGGDAGRKLLDLGGGLRAELLRGTITIRATKRAADPEVAPPAALLIPGSTRWSGWEIRAELVRPGIARPGDGSPRVELVDPAALSGALAVRSRLPGDRFRPLGAPGSKKLKEFLRERGVAEDIRDRVPLVADSRGIVWVVGHRIGEPYKLRPTTQEAVRLTAIPQDEELRNAECGMRNDGEGF
jgi:tRNA(Ile)-lysidine synthase